jgi:hypothetical protein
MPQPWYKSTWRRAVLDMHITDDDERFLSAYDPEAYAENLARARTKSAVVYAMGHVGLALYPSRVIPPHRGLKGRDLFGGTLAACHARGIGVAAYLSGIFDLWAYRNNPDWKIMGIDGAPVAERSRYGTCCPNSPYRGHVAGFVKELCERYAFEGIRIDMTFWPHVCYCRHCKARFAAEVGGELPVRIDWSDRRWTAFQHKREEWLAEYAGLLTATALAARPGLSVEHQASTFPFNWKFGVSTPLVRHNTFLQGDFYGDALQGSMARKLFSNLSPDLPAAYETSIGVSLQNYTAIKPKALLRTKAHAALADCTAFVYIDSVDPLGTVNPLVYARMGEVFEETSPYEPFLGGHRVEDVAVYFSLDSKFDPADNGKPVDDPHLSPRMPHFEAVSAVARMLLERHVPFGIITRGNLAELERWRLIVVPGIMVMDDEEAAALRAYVRAGGALYASGPGLLRTPDGSVRPDFALTDVLGVSYKGDTGERFTFMAPTAAGAGLFGDFTASHPLGVAASQTIAAPAPGSEVLGTITLPYTDPDDPIHFSSTHNNPPGVATAHPALVGNGFGKGRAVWAAGGLETSDGSQEVMAALVTRLAGPFTVTTDAPPVVEITVFRQDEHRRFVLSLVNFPRELPAVPVHDISVRLRVDGAEVRGVFLLPSREPIKFSHGNGEIGFTVPRLDVFAMIAAEWN